MRACTFLATTNGDFEKALKGENDGTESNIAALENRLKTLKGLNSLRDCFKEKCHIN